MLLPEDPSELLSLWDNSDEHGCVCISGLAILAATLSLSSSNSTSSIVLHKVHAFEEHDSLLCILLGVVGQSLNGDVSISAIETCVSSLDDLVHGVVGEV